MTDLKGMPPNIRVEQARLWSRELQVASLPQFPRQRTPLNSYAERCGGEGPVLPIRNVARVIVIDASGAVLLCRYSEAGRTYWVPPGGALEPGEGHEAAALRELREETGLAASLEAELWERRFVLQMKDGPVDQVERYFLVRLALEQPEVSNTSTEDICELRWWTLHELQSGEDRIYPDGLVEQLPGLLSGSLPERPGNPTRACTRKRAR